VGDDIELEIEGRETTWHVVGIMRPPTAAPTAYADYAYLARVTRDVGRANAVYVVTEQHDADTQVKVAEALEKRFDEEGLSVTYVSTVAEAKSGIAILFDIIIVFLMSMALLVAVVGGIGLMGTMLLNVLERIREVGVMRAIGAKTDAVLQIFIVEGVIMGLISWAIGAALAYPLGKVIGYAVGQQFLSFPISYTYSLAGVVIWLVAAIVISIVSSWAPAQNAARLTVREVLAYS
jgi:putative ABC transport system permease protein